MARLAPAAVRVGSTGRILGLVVLMTPLSGAGIDIYVPSLPSMTEYFHTTPALIQLTITMYLLGYGSAQLAMGAASEILGRRPVVVAGSLIYTATALGVALSPTVPVLLAFRFLQGVALSATGTLNRSILTDTFSGAELAKASNAMTLAWALGPIVAPVLGAWLHERFGWQSCFWFLTAYGLALFVLLLTSLPETIAHRRPLDVAALTRELGSFLKDHVFVAAALVLALMYSYIAVFSMVAPFLVQRVLPYSAGDSGVQHTLPGDRRHDQHHRSITARGPGAVSSGVGRPLEGNESTADARSVEHGGEHGQAEEHRRERLHAVR